MTSKNRIYKQIYNQGRASKAELSRQLGLSMPTVLQSVKQLIGDGLLTDVGPMKAGGSGRKPVALACVPDARVAIGLYVKIGRAHV